MSKRREEKQHNDTVKEGEHNRQVLPGVMKLGIIKGKYRKEWRKEGIPYLLDYKPGLEQKPASITGRVLIDV